MSAIDTPEWDLEQAHQDALHEYYERTWPNYCRTCQGAGIFSYTENGAPHGAGFWPMPMTEPCPDCFEEGYCPRCRRQATDDEWEKWGWQDNPDGKGYHFVYFVCPGCGWDEENPDICPASG